jgi:hypothetical protein
MWQRCANFEISRLSHGHDGWRRRVLEVVVLVMGWLRDKATVWSDLYVRVRSSIILDPARDRLGSRHLACRVLLPPSGGTRTPT